MTNHWIDIQHSDVILIQGSNAAENHPISFKWVMRAKDKGGKIIHVDPRFTRTSAKADVYAPIRAGTDIAFIGGMIKYIIENKKYFEDYVLNYTNASFIVSEKFAFKDGLLAGYDPKTRKYDKSSWVLEKDENGIPKQDKSLKNPRCVLNMMYQHYKRYDLDKVSSITGTPKDKLLEVYELFASTGVKDRAGTIMYALGQTQSTIGVQKIRSLCMMQLLLGNIGICGGGVNALRGEPNVQGSTDHAILYHYLPGYLPVPRAGQQALDEYIKAVTPASKDARSANWPSNTPKYVVSLLKSWFGDAATPENGFGYSWLPKCDDGQNCDVLHMIDDMYAGNIKGYFCIGQNPCGSLPNSNKVRAAMTKLDWMVHVNIFDNESASFWKGPGLDPKKVKTECFLLPAAANLEKDGSQANSGRWMQWLHRAVKNPGDCLSTGAIVTMLMHKLQAMYKKDGGATPDGILNMRMDYLTPDGKEFDATKVARRINGEFERDVTIGDKEYKKGQTVPGFGLLQADGSTSSGNWLCAGSFSLDGKNLMDRRGKEDPTGLGLYPNWSYCWPMNRRVVYNRASVDPQGNPYNPARALLQWKDGKWVGDVADGPWPPLAMEGGKLPFIMKPDGVAAFFGPGLNDGPFPEHYEPLESPLKQNLMSKQHNSPVITIFKSDMDKVASADPKYPLVLTTYSATEHWCSGAITRWQSWLTEAMPQVYVEISEELAAERGLKNGEWVTVSSARGRLDAVAMVTPRLRPLTVGGKLTHTVGMTFNYGWLYPKDSGDTCNLLTTFVGDGNAGTPEYKACMVNISKKA
jgi:formate dehydrogenase major subunit